MVDTSKYVGPYAVRIIDWVDGKTIYMNMTYHVPGQRLSDPPRYDRSVLIAKTTYNEWFLTEFLNSVVFALMEMPEENFEHYRKRRSEEGKECIISFEGGTIYGNH